jgi:glucans biosynthesis protein C
MEGQQVAAPGRDAEPGTPDARRTRPGRESERVHAFDALRGIAMLLVVALHAAVPYMDLPLAGAPWPGRAASDSAVLSYVFWWLHGFQMPLFFLLAGFFSAQLDATHGPAAFLRHRARRVIVPFLVGGLFILPLTFYIFAAGWWLDGTCTWNEIRRVRFQPHVQAELFGPAHLWFLEYLFLCCVVHSALRALPRLLDRTPGIQRPVARCGRLLLSGWRPLWCAIPTAVVLGADPSIFMAHHNSFAPSPWGVAYYAVYFCTGVALHRVRAGLDPLVRGSAAYLICSVPPFACVLWLVRAQRVGPLTSDGRLLLALSVALFAWLSLFGFLGVSVAAFRRRRASLRYLSEASYWIYLIHLPIVVGVQVAISQTGAPVVLKFLVVTALSTVFCLWSYERWVRYTPVGALLNGGGRSLHRATGWKWTGRFAPSALPGRRHPGVAAVAP